MANLREVKKMIIADAAVRTRYNLLAGNISPLDLGLKDTRAVRERIIRACNELEDRYA